MTTPRIQSALDELVSAIQEETLASFQAMLSGQAAPVRAASSPRASAAAKAPRASKARAKGAKRTAEEIDEQIKVLLAAIKKNPGQRIEQISKEIGISTKELALPVLKLFDAKAIRTTGTRRATKYFPK